jgi:hypothetical protein
MSRNAFPAAVAVSIGCSVARSAAPFRLQRPHDVLEVAHGAGQAVNAGDDQLVALADEVEEGVEFDPPPAAGTGLRLLSDDGAARGPQGGDLDR